MDTYEKLRADLNKHGLNDYFTEYTDFKSLFEATEKEGIMQTKCLGCGRFYIDYDDSCPAGTSESLHEGKIKEFLNKQNTV